MQLASPSGPGDGHCSATGGDRNGRREPLGGKERVTGPGGALPRPPTRGAPTFSTHLCPWALPGAQVQNAAGGAAGRGGGAAGGEEPLTCR